jgi:hypothetical protein
MDTKPGYKTTEFWLTLLAAVLGVLIQFDVIPTEGDGWVAKVVSAVVLALGAAGYAVSRGLAKSGKIGVLLLAGALCLTVAGCGGGTFHAEGVIDLEAYPDAESTAGMPTISVPLQLAPMLATPAYPSSSVPMNCPPCPPGNSGEMRTPSSQ